MSEVEDLERMLQMDRARRLQAYEEATHESDCRTDLAIAGLGLLFISALMVAVIAFIFHQWFWR